MQEETCCLSQRQRCRYKTRKGRETGDGSTGTWMGPPLGQDGGRHAPLPACLNEDTPAEASSCPGATRKRFGFASREDSQDAKRHINRYSRATDRGSYTGKAVERAFCLKRPTGLENRQRTRIRDAQGPQVLFSSTACWPRRSSASEGRASASQASNWSGADCYATFRRETVALSGARWKISSGEKAPPRRSNKQI